MELSDDIVTTTRTPSQMERSLLAIPKGATRIAWIGPLLGACDGRASPLLQRQTESTPRPKFVSLYSFVHGASPKSCKIWVTKRLQRLSTVKALSRQPHVLTLKYCYNIRGPLEPNQAH